MRVVLKTMAAIGLLGCSAPAEAQAVDDQKARALIMAGVLKDPYDVRQAVLSECPGARFRHIQIKAEPYWHYVVELSDGTRLEVDAQKGVERIRGRCPN